MLTWVSRKKDLSLFSISDQTRMLILIILITLSGTSLADEQPDTRQPAASEPVAADDLSDFSLDDGHIAGGTGFRYLISRIFAIRTGMDFARSEDDFVFYFTSGTAWGQK